MVPNFFEFFSINNLCSHTVFDAWKWAKSFFHVLAIICLIISSRFPINVGQLLLMVLDNSSGHDQLIFQCICVVPQFPDLLGQVYC